MPNGYNLGLVSVSFRDRTPEEILQAMQRVGLTHIEWGSDVHALCTDKVRLFELAAMQAKYGITCSSYGTYFRLGKTPLDELESYIAAAKILGTDVLRLWCGSKNAAEMTEAEKSVFVAECRAAAEIAAREGVTLCMECHIKSFTERVEDAAWLMQEVSSPHFKMYWQPFQWQTGEENVQNAQRIAPFATHIHVFNWRGEEKLPLIGAVEEWRAYLKHFSTPRTLLLEFMPNGTLDELAAETAALKEITEVLS